MNHPPNDQRHESNRSLSFPSGGASEQKVATDGVDLIEYLRILRRRWLLVTLVTFLSISITAFVTLRMTKIYRATTSINIETRAPQVLGQQVENVVEMGTGSFWSNVEYYETQYQIIKSRDVALRVVEEFKLNENPRFLGIPEGERTSFEPATPEIAAEILQGMLTVEPMKDSRVALIHVDSDDPAMAQLLANEVTAAYVTKNLEKMLQGTVDAEDWLSKQLDEAMTKLNASEEALREYKRENAILSISLEDKQNLISTQMNATAAALSEAIARKIEVQSRKNAIAKVADMKDPMAIPIESLNSNALIQQLKKNYADLSQEYGELSARYGDNFPRMVELKAKMDRIKTDISREVNNIISSVDQELVAAKSTVAGLENRLTELKGEAQELAAKEGGYLTYSREAVNNEKIYELLLGRTKEAGLSRLLNVNNVEPLDAALLPEQPIKPRVKVNLALGAVFGLILGVLLAVFIEFADRTVKTPEDVEALGVAFLGIVPSMDFSLRHKGNYYEEAKNARPAGSGEGHKLPDEINYDHFVHDYPKSQVAESLRSIRTNIMFMSAEKKGSRFLVTSASPQEGKTTVACNLAAVMAQSGSRVLLIDADMRRPRIHKAFKIPRSNQGMSTLILGSSTVKDAIIQTRIPNLDILPCGPTPPNPSELIHGAEFKRAVELAVVGYDTVIFDSPPIGIVTDAAILSKLVDGTLLILKSLKTSRDAAKHAVTVMKDIDATILGAILNDLNPADKKYGKHYYHYYNQYGYYYGSDDEGAEGSSTEKA